MSFNLSLMGIVAYKLLSSSIKRTSFSLRHCLFSSSVLRILRNKSCRGNFLGLLVIVHYYVLFREMYQKKIGHRVREGTTIHSVYAIIACNIRFQ